MFPGLHQPNFALFAIRFSRFEALVFNEIMKQHFKKLHLKSLVFIVYIRLKRNPVEYFKKESKFK